MQAFLNKTLKFLLPLIVIAGFAVGSFYYYDPFCILKEYDSFNNSIVEYNEDFLATERYLKNADKYNSFIFGSSRAGCGYNTERWSNLIGEQGNAYNYAASCESIYGIYGKIRLIDEKGGKLKNVLLVFDADGTFHVLENNKGHIFVKHPEVSKESWRSFVSIYLKDYIFSGFVIRYLDYKIFRTRRDYMEGFLQFDSGRSDEEYTAFKVGKNEHLIADNKEKYYNDREEIFYCRDGIRKESDELIGLKAIEYLNNISAYFKKHNTDYRVIISPLYDQVEFNKKDLYKLCKVFGKGRVFDFSGINHLTSDKHNYYEISHYRETVGDTILSRIYTQKISN